MSEQIGLNKTMLGIKGLNEQGEQDACLRLYSEQDWIDWLLGSIPETRAAEMAAHAAGCPSCQMLKRRWEGIFGTNLDEDQGQDGEYEAVETVDTVRATQAAVAAAIHAYDPEAEFPRDRIRKQLRHKVRMIGFRRKIKGLFASRWKWTLGFAAALMLLALFWAALPLAHPDTEWNRYVKIYEPEALPVLSDPQTVSYPLHWGGKEPQLGKMWYNADSKEVLMLVGGLVPGKGQTVRVWLVNQSSEDNLGLLRYDANRAHLYVKDKTISPADNIVLTIEPEGGPARVHADSDAAGTISVDLNER
ncbi:hypothetical protein AWM70_02345 [Paenibacillus yonginensis]|uniref:Anti-sigma K factor RskA C-terminal domain-containing protein n=1 Tax=Paenibacillus yonginensis TaxID=1462996 RepID=A0A1B1MWM5_9BACL|nr:anti-sigma factor [Paenibacillus yonginensis]ANS73559.1 hypothetical protein AWM70_02345 [Paenibacillus yonginensis]